MGKEICGINTYINDDELYPGVSAFLAKNSSNTTGFTVYQYPQDYKESNGQAYSELLQRTLMAKPYYDGHGLTFIQDPHIDKLTGVAIPFNGTLFVAPESIRPATMRDAYEHAYQPGYATHLEVREIIYHLVKQGYDLRLAEKAPKTYKLKIITDLKAGKKITVEEALKILAEE